MPSLAFQGYQYTKQRCREILEKTRTKIGRWKREEIALTDSCNAFYRLAKHPSDVTLGSKCQFFRNTFLQLHFQPLGPESRFRTVIFLSQHNLPDSRSSHNLCCCSSIASRHSVGHTKPLESTNQPVVGCSRDTEKTGKEDWRKWTICYFGWFLSLKTQISRKIRSKWMVSQEAKAAKDDGNQLKSFLGHRFFLLRPNRNFAILGWSSYLAVFLLAIWPFFNPFRHEFKDNDKIFVLSTSLHLGMISGF